MQQYTYNCCLRGFLRGLISTGGLSPSSTGSCFIGGRESSPASPSPGDEVAEIVVEPPEELPPLPRDSGRRGDGGDAGAPLFRAAKTGARFFCAFRGELTYKPRYYNVM
jgi:hypothetical protein